METIKWAWKNVLRNPRRSVLNITALGLGFGIMILGLGWVEGYHTSIYGALRNFETGDLQYLAQGYREEQRRLPVDITLDSYESRRAQLVQDPRVLEASGRVDFAVRLSHGGESLRLMARAIDPAREARITTIENYLTRGANLEEGPGLLLGEPLAQALDLEPGDTVFLSAFDRHGVENLVDLRIRGIFHLGYPLMDRNLVFLDLDSAAFLLDLEDRVNRLVVKLEPEANMEDFLENPTPLETGGDWFPWQSFAQAAVSAVEADSGSFYAMVVILFLVISLGMLNSLSMSVHERTRECGTLRALGLRRNQLVGLFLRESVIMVALALVLGGLLTAPLVWWLGTVGVDITGAMPAEMPVPFGERFRADFQVGHYLLASLVTLFSGVFGAWLPSRRAARLPIAEALGGRAV